VGVTDCSFERRWHRRGHPPPLSARLSVTFISPSFRPVPGDTGMGVSLTRGVFSPGVRRGEGLMSSRLRLWRSTHWRNSLQRHPGVISAGADCSVWIGRDAGSRRRNVRRSTSIGRPRNFSSRGRPPRRSGRRRRRAWARPVGGRSGAAIVCYSAALALRAGHSSTGMRGTSNRSVTRAYQPPPCSRPIRSSFGVSI
jgi:hypothetical protein